MADLTTLQARLTEAEAAYHSLLTGTLEVNVGQGDMRAAYNLANADKLAAYILQLQAQIAAAGGTSVGQRRRGLVVDL